MKGKKIKRVSFESDRCGTATTMTNHGFGGSLQVSKLRHAAKAPTNDDGTPRRFELRLR